MAIVLPSVIQAAPAVPLGPNILSPTHNPGHGIRIVDFLLSPSLSPSDKRRLLKQAIIREQAEAAASGRGEKHSTPRHPDDNKRLEKRQMRIWKSKNDTADKSLPSVAKILSELKCGKKKDTGKDKRNYEGPLSDDDDDILIRKTRGAFEQKTVVVDEKIMVNEPRYLRKEQMIRRPTHPVEYKEHRGENSKL
ncbi:Ff.00g071190.m01.CDS01 [Fusarium sp. VM40]|nr:Ff.00g071190.m01.CDS01 [Fusarium sp. VM40]